MKSYRTSEAILNSLINKLNEIASQDTSNITAVRKDNINIKTYPQNSYYVQTAFQELFFY